MEQMRPMGYLGGRFTLFFLALSVIIAISGCNRNEGPRPVMQIGYMICNSEEETAARFGPITKYLSDKTGIDFEMVVVDTHEFDDRFAAGEFAVTHTNSLLYVILREHHNLQILAAERRGNFGARTAGAIVARRDSGIASLEDIRGKRMIFGPMMAPTGYLAEYDLMQKAGIDPELDLAYYAFPGGSFKHEKLIYKVLFGEFDVAAAPVLDLEVMSKEGKIAPDDFVILAQSPLIPYCTFGAAEDLDPDLVARIQKALMELTPETTVEIGGERLKVLKAAWIDGFELLDDSEYDIIRDMARRTNMPPYQTF